MKLVIVTDAWQPQVNGVVTTLVELVRELRLLGHEVDVISPSLFRTWPCPGYPGIDLALWPRRRLTRLLDEAQPDAIHIATEGPLGWAARAHCRKRGLAFSTAFHTKFPELLHAALKLPLNWSYAVFRRFHRPAAAVMAPTRGVQTLLTARGFVNVREWTHGVDTDAFPFTPEPQVYEPVGRLVRPVSLFVGRISYEKNIEAFLQLDVPGTKVVCGEGPLQQQLRERHPEARWLGVLSRAELARVYAAADVFVLPSRCETFGLVLLEAMSCGVPVAAYPVDGPTEVLGDSPAGALRDNLGDAWHEALKLSRHDARARAMAFSWGQATTSFLSHLVPCKAQAFTPLSQKLHPVAE